jgi:hypothetical protein
MEKSINGFIKTSSIINNISVKPELPNKSDEMLQRSLLAIPMKRFTGYVEKSIYDVM